MNSITPVLDLLFYSLLLLFIPGLTYGGILPDSKFPNSLIISPRKMEVDSTDLSGSDFSLTAFALRSILEQFVPNTSRQSMVPACISGFGNGDCNPNVLSSTSPAWKIPIAVKIGVAFAVLAAILFAGFLKEPEAYNQSGYGYGPQDSGMNIGYSTKRSRDWNLIHGFNDFSFSLDILANKVLQAIESYSDIN